MSKTKYAMIVVLFYVFGIVLIISIYGLMDFIMPFKTIKNISENYMFFLIAFVASITFFVWAYISNTGKVYSKIYARRIERQSNKEIAGTGYYKDIPEYIGPNCFDIEKFPSAGIIIGAAFLAIMILESILWTIRGILPVALCVFLILICAGVVWYFLAGKDDKKVTIDENGVSLKRIIDGEIKAKILSWENIKTVGISVAFSGKRIPWGFLYFTVKELKRDKVIPEYFEKSYVIMLRYRPEAIHCVLKYWDKEIRNLDAMKSWKKYLKKCERR